MGISCGSLRRPMASVPLRHATLVLLVRLCKEEDSPASCSISCASSSDRRARRLSVSAAVTRALAGRSSGLCCWRYQIVVGSMITWVGRRMLFLIRPHSRVRPQRVASQIDCTSLGRASDGRVDQAQVVARKLCATFALLKTAGLQLDARTL